MSGHPLVGAVPKLDMPWLEPVPVIGKIFAHMDLFTWLSFVLVLACTCSSIARHGGCIFARLGIIRLQRT